MEWWIPTIIIFGVMFLLLAAGAPMVLGTAALAVGSLYLFVGPKVLTMLATKAFESSTNFVLIALPLFILMGEAIIISRIGENGFEVAQKWFGRLPGGLNLAAVAACALFAAILGSNMANAAIVGQMALPEMAKRGYDRKLAVGTIAAGGTLGVLIPPSTLMVLFAVITEESLGHLFMAGVFPGLLVAGLFMGYIAVRCWLNPTLAPKSDPVSWRDRFFSMYKLGPILVLLVAVLVSIYLGVASPTEAAAVGAFGAIVIGIINRQLTPRRLMEALVTTARNTCLIFIGLALASSLTFALASLEIPQLLGRWVISLEISRWWVMVAINVLYLLIGTALGPPVIMILTLPVVFPVVTMLGFDPVWFGIIFTINMCASDISPPVGGTLFVLKVVAPKDVTWGDIFMGALPFMLFQILALVILSIFPQIALWLPGTMVRRF